MTTFRAVPVRSLVIRSDMAHRMCFVALSCALVPPDLFGPQTTQLHQARLAVLTSDCALVLELAIDPRTAMGIVAAIIYGLDFLVQFSYLVVQMLYIAFINYWLTSWGNRGTVCLW